MQPTWEAGDVQLYLGDCLEVLPTLEAGSVDAVVTDPPYSTPTVNSFGREVVRRLSDLAIQEHYFGTLKKELERMMALTSPLLVFCDDAYYPVLFATFYHWKQVNLLIWDKGRIGMGNPFRRRHELIFYANRASLVLNREAGTHIPTILKASPVKEYHAAEKPMMLIARLMKGLTTQGQSVLDPFMGSGTTGVACVKTGRKFIGIEIDEGYFDIAVKRITEAQMQPRLEGM